MKSLGFKLKFILLIFVLPLILVSCTHLSKHKDYRLAKDGLIYKFDSKELYSGKIIDTADVIIEYYVVNGKQNGKFLARFLNGNPEKVGFILNNRNEGEWRYYYPNGNLESVGYFESNKATGNWKYFYPDGSLKCEAFYVEGKAEGSSLLYNPSGEIFNIIYYRKGEITGSYMKIT